MGERGGGKVWKGRKVVRKDTSRVGEEGVGIEVWGGEGHVIEYVLHK